VIAKDEPMCTYKQNFKSMGSDSYNMRELIFNHLTVVRSGNTIKSVNFGDKILIEKPASPPLTKTATKKSIVA
jgi:hypothetical protein